VSRDALDGKLALALRATGQSLASITLRHSLAQGSGMARLQTSELEFTSAGFQPVALSPLLRPFARAAGRARFDGTLVWSTGKLSSHGELRLQDFGFSSPAGDVTGVNANIELTSLIPLQSAPHQVITAARLGTTAPLTQLSAHFELLPTAVRLEDLRMSFAGGAIIIDPVTIALDPRAALKCTVRLQDIDLNTLIAASSLADRITLDVHVSGSIPVAYSPGSLTITAGSVFSTGPGHLAISRNIWSSAASAKTNAVGDFAYQALEHLAVEEMDGTVNTLSGARVGLKLHIKGRHDPPVAVPTHVGILDLLRGHAFDRPLPLPKGTPIDLTLDSSLNLGGLLDAYRASFYP
jgi:hypothetical protein